MRWLSREAAQASPRTRLGVALLGGLALVFAFPNPLVPGLQAWPAALAWAGLLPLLWLAWGREPRSAFRDGFRFGFAFFAASLVYLNNVRPMGPGALPAWLALSAWCALFPALFALAVSLGSRQSWPAPLLWLPAAWTMSEFLRERALTGYPWVSLGSSQWSNPALLPLAGAAGPAGLHFAVAFGNAVLFALFLRPELAVGWRRWAQGAAAISVIIALTAAGKSRAPQSDPSRPAVKVAVLQGNIDQDQPWTPQYRRHLMGVYLGLMDQARGQGAKVMVWPESAFPGFFNLDSSEASASKDYARKHGVDLVIGSTWATEGGTSFENSAVHLAPDGRVELYSKRRLVPFGEFIPFRAAIPLLDTALRRLGYLDFIPGRAPARFQVQGLRVAPLICYESLYPGLARAGGEMDLLVVVTLDTWFGRSAAPYHHASQACLRAVENGAWVARAAATGVSAFISPEGRLLSALQLDKPGFLVQTVHPLRGETLYQRWGELFNAVCLLLLGACAVSGKRRK